MREIKRRKIHMLNPDTDEIYCGFIIKSLTRYVANWPMTTCSRCLKYKDSDRDDTGIMDTYEEE